MKENVRAMRAARSEKAARLLGALGEIDSAYLDEYIRAEGPAGAENDEKRLYAPQISPAKRRFPWRVAVPVAAAFLLLVTVGGSFLLPAMFVGRAKSAMPSKAEKSDGQYYDVATGNARFEEDGATIAPSEAGKTVPEMTENNALRALGQTLENATPARTLASAAAPDNLRHERECPLIAAVIAGEQRLIDRDHTDQRDIREIESLADHLRAAENVILMIGKGAEAGFVGSARHGCVGIHAQDFRIRQQRLQLLLELLRPESHLPQPVIAALRANGHRRLHMSAVVAEQRAVRLVIGHRHRAVRAVDRFIAFGTLQQRVIAAPVEQQNALFAALQIFIERLRERNRERTAVAVRPLKIHVHDCDRRQRRLIIPLGHFQQPVDTALRQITAFERGCCRSKHQCRIVIFRASFRHIRRMVPR